MGTDPDRPQFQLTGTELVQRAIVLLDLDPREALLLTDWCYDDLCHDPHQDATPRPGANPNVWIRRTPLPGIWAVYLIANQFNAVQLVRFMVLTDDGMAQIGHED